MRNRIWIGIPFAALALVSCGEEEDTRLGGDGKLTIAMIAKSASNPVFLSARDGAEAAARALSEQHGVPIEVSWMTPEVEDGRVQAQRVAEAVRQGADAILISASDAAELSGAVNDAAAQGVPVMTFDSDLPDSQRFSFLGVDDLEIGRRVMRELAAAIGEGPVAVLAGNEAAPNLQRRVQGVREEAARHPGIQLIGVFHHEETPEAATAEVMRVQRANPTLRGWAMVGGWPLFGAGLMDQLDPARVTIVAVDGLPGQLPYVEKGLASMLLAQPTYMWGYVGVQAITDRLLTEKAVLERIPMQPVPVHRQNLGSWARQLRDWGFQDVPERFLAM